MRVHGVWQLTPQRVAVHVPTATAVLADLHLGYCEARQRRGDAVPTPVLEEILQPLARVLREYHLRRILIAGDLFEDGVNDKIAQTFLDWVVNQNVELIGVVPGNHDRKPSRLRLSTRASYSLDDWLIVHGDSELPDGPAVCGHFHPSWRAAGRNWPCYLVGPRRIVLPAFTADASGAGLQGWAGYRCLVPVGAEVLDFGPPKTGSRRGGRATRRLPG
jgi:uncharacterized protein